MSFGVPEDVLCDTELRIGSEQAVPRRPKTVVRGGSIMGSLPSPAHRHPDLRAHHAFRGPVE
jgi:hypothetical protein